MAINNTFGKSIIPENDGERLANLKSYGLLEDDAPIQALNNIAALVAKHFHAPIALVSLVGAEEVYFKGNFGMARARSTNRGVSLCSLGILTDSATVFEKPLTEPCLMANPLVQGNFGLRFYAGIPLKTRAGFNIGTLCIVDKKERKFSKEEEETLKQFASVVMSDIELRRDANMHAAEQEKEIKSGKMQLAETNRELNHSREEAKTYHFISNHNFQEPLRKIQLFTGLILDKHLSAEDEKGKSMATRVVSMVEDFRRMIRDIDVYNTLTVENTTHQQVDLDKILGKICNELSGEITSRKAVMNIGHLPTLPGVADQLQTLFFQLIDNALKFAKPGQAPVIDISYKILDKHQQEAYKELSPQKDFFKISITDNGIGIIKDRVDTIYGLFSKQDTGNILKTTGMGLSYCRKIVRNHMGTIYFTSQPGVGTTFNIILPTA